MPTATLEKPAKKPTLAQAFAKPDVYDLDAQDSAQLRNNTAMTEDRALMAFYYEQRHNRREIPLGLAMNVHTRSEWLAEFARTEDVSVRRAVANHARTDEATFRYLVDEPQHLGLEFNVLSVGGVAYSSLTLAVAENPACPEALLEELSTHKWESVRRLVAVNPATHARVLLRLAAKDAKAAVRNRALAREAHIRAYLASRHSELVTLPLKEAASALHPKRTRHTTGSHKTA